MARLLHHFTPLFSYGLALDEKVSANQASETAASVIARARELIDRAKAASLADGKRRSRRGGLGRGGWIDETWRATRTGRADTVAGHDVNTKRRNESSRPGDAEQDQTKARGFSTAPVRSSAVIYENATPRNRKAEGSTAAVAGGDRAIHTLLQEKITRNLRRGLRQYTAAMGSHLLPHRRAGGAADPYLRLLCWRRPKLRPGPCEKDWRLTCWTAGQPDETKGTVKATAKCHALRNRGQATVEGGRE